MHSDRHPAPVLSLSRWPIVDGYLPVAEARVGELGAHARIDASGYGAVLAAVRG